MRKIRILLVLAFLMIAPQAIADSICAKIHDELLGFAKEPLSLIQGKIYGKNTDFYFQNPHNRKITIEYQVTNNNAQKKTSTKTLKPYQWARARGIGFKFTDETTILSKTSNECEAFWAVRQKTVGDHAIEKGATMGVVGGALLGICTFLTGGACLGAAPIFLIL